MSIIAGQRMNDLPPEKRDIAMVFQFYALYPALTVGENIAMPLHYEKLSKAEIDERVMKVADDPPPRPTCSTGCRARSRKARSSASPWRAPSCAIPTASSSTNRSSRLDVELRQSMRGQIKEVLSGLSKATVIVTHDQLEALTMADRIAIMRDGLIEQVGTPHDVFAKPANVFVAQLHRHAADESGRGRSQAHSLHGQAAVDTGRQVRSRSRSIRQCPSLKPEGQRSASARGPSRRRTEARQDTIDGPGRTDRADGRRNPDPCPHAQIGGDIRVVVPRDMRVKMRRDACICGPIPAQTHFFGEDGKAVRA